MGTHADALQLQSKRVRVDERQNASSGERIARRNGSERPARHRTAAHRQRGIECELPTAPVLDVDGQSRSGVGDAPVVAMVHVHERRDMQHLLGVPLHYARAVALDHIGVALAPWSVRHLGNDCLHPLPGFVEAVVEADGVEAVPERTQLGEDPDRPARPRTRALLDEGAHRLVERDARIAEVVGALEPDQPAARERLLEVEIHERELVLELVRALREAAVADGALVDRARGHESRAPKRSATRTPLTTPSSWKPQPQYAPQ